MAPRKSRLLATLVAVLLLPALASLSVVASAEGGKTGKKKKGDDAAATASASASGPRHDPDNVTAISEYMETCVAGNGKYAARDFPGAIALYQKAIALNPKNALGHYLLGEAQLAAGNMAEAEAAWGRASLESNEKDASLRARVLFVIADLKERQKKWDDAKAAWQVYLDWANRYPNAAVFPSSAQSRQQVIDAMVKQDKAYVVVRQRIAETKAGNVFTDLSKTPAPAGS